MWLKTDSTEDGILMQPFEKSDMYKTASIQRQLLCACQFGGTHCLEMLQSATATVSLSLSAAAWHIFKQLSHNCTVTIPFTALANLLQQQEQCVVS